MKITASHLVAVLLLAVAPAPAQSPPAPPAAPEAGDVKVGDQIVIRIFVPAGQVSPKDRAAAVQERLDRARREGAVAPADVAVRLVDSNPSIFIRNRLIVTVYGADGEAYRMTAAALAESWAVKLRDILATAPVPPPADAAPPAAPTAPPPAPAPAPTAPAAPAAPTAPAAPPATSGPPWPMRLGFERLSHYKARNENFRNGWASGVYEAVAIFNAAAGSGGIDKTQAQALYGCLAGKGNKSNQLRDWINAVVGAKGTRPVEKRAPKPSPEDPVATAVARACKSALAPATFLWRVSNYLQQDSSFTLGYAAGIFDGVSLMTAALDGSDAGAKARGLLACLDSKGDKVSELRAWMDSAIQNASNDTLAAGIVAGACPVSGEAPAVQPPASTPAPRP